MTEDRGPDGAPTPETPTIGSEPAAPPPLAPYVAAASTPPPPVPPPAVQPAVTWAAAPAPAVAGPGQRTALALIAGVIMVIGALLFGLAGLAVAVLGRAVIESMGDLGQFPGLEGIDAGALASGIMTFVGIIILFLALVYLIGGIGIIRNRGWGRVIGLIVGILGGLAWLSSVVTPDPNGVGSSIAGSLVMFGIHAYIAVVLLFFWRTRPSIA